jgi:predicted transcriptional regulator
MLSIRPKWVEKIARGEKTIEVRKTRPKMDTPFKCYIYCTIGGRDLNIPISQERLMRDYMETGSMKSLNCTLKDMHDYLHAQKGYGWHITDLRIYDAPRELSEFLLACPNSWYCESCAMYWENNGTCGNESLQIKHAPQSWCYVEAMEDV